MEKQADKNLEDALSKLKQDGVEVKVEETGKGDNYLIIKTKKYEARIGANDLGVWLVYVRERK